jgi:NAD(P)-dependent dehydrogenase (short-subunit alcohol dehydrogenase family)
MNKVLILGASGGLGRSLEALYKEKKWQTSALNRRDCDLSDERAVDLAIQSSADLKSPPDLCIFASGACEAGYLDELGQDSIRKSMTVNFLSPVRTFQHLASGPHPCPSFIFVLSGVADFLIPGLAPYALSKRALRDYLAVC